MKNDFNRILEGISKSKIREFFDLVIGAEDVISLGVGEPDFATPWTIREEAIYALERGRTTYTSNQGLLSLREAISEYMRSRFDCAYDPKEEILITNGVSEGVDIVLRAMLNPGDEVIVPEPMYVCYGPLIKMTGATQVTIDTSGTGFVPSAAAIEAAITPKTKGLVLCYPNNPTGMSIPESELRAIADVVKRHDIWVISDEIYAELSYGVPFVSIASFEGMKENTVLLSGFSKSFAMTGWRVGYICAPESIVSRACKIHQYSALCTSIISQIAAEEALQNSLSEVSKMRWSYQQRRNLFCQALNGIGLKVTPPDGAIYCFVDIRAIGLSSHDFAVQLLQQYKVAVVPGTAFGECGEGFIRCCFATEISELKEAISRISDFVESVRGGVKKVGKRA
ncbi:MAG: aminotransferase class I/II-fold pyridoxal phosphate-dependent enzyme [bacterium]|nr:aminotransferase class I/II-fold pyridoxal phosphate-dependent enzyme [bacterium]